MKKIAGVLGVALALSAAPVWAGDGHQGTAFAAFSAVGPGLGAFAKDEEDSTEGDPESDGVVDPTPQDDGSDGVDDGTGDA